MGKSGGGGSNEIKETAAQQAAAKVAAKQWNMYQTELKPFENLFMQKVAELNGKGEYQARAAEAGLGYATSFGQAREAAGTELAAAGVDPTSGKYQATMDDLTSEQMAGQADTVARAQTSQQDKYVAGLKDIVAIGAGQKAEAVQGYQNIADSSMRKAASEAEMAHRKNLSNRAGTASLVGAVAGAGANYGLSSLNAAPMSHGSTGEQLSSASLSSNKLYNPQATTHVGGR